MPSLENASRGGARLHKKEPSIRALRPDACCPPVARVAVEPTEQRSGDSAALQNGCPNCQKRGPWAACFDVLLIKENCSTEHSALLRFWSLQFFKRFVESLRFFGAEQEVLITCTGGAREDACAARSPPRGGSAGGAEAGRRRERRPARRTRRPCPRPARTPKCTRSPPTRSR